MAVVALKPGRQQQRQSLCNVAHTLHPFTGALGKAAAARRKPRRAIKKLFPILKKKTVQHPKRAQPEIEIPRLFLSNRHAHSQKLFPCFPDSFRICATHTHTYVQTLSDSLNVGDHQVAHFQHVVYGVSLVVVRGRGSYFVNHCDIRVANRAQLV